jgi:hypothetical protein
MISKGCHFGSVQTIVLPTLSRILLSIANDLSRPFHRGLSSPWRSRRSLLPDSGAQSSTGRFQRMFRKLSHKTPLALAHVTL